MRNVTIAALATAALLLLARPAAAWGPATHYHFACTAMGIDIASCAAHRDLLSGTEMPDAFGFPSVLSPVGRPALPCGEWKYLGLHSPVFAGYLLHAAPKHMTPEFNATEFALGFGIHVSADAAGFYADATNPGYLGRGWGEGYETPKAVANTANWVALWPFMEAVDAYTWATLLKPGNMSALPTHVPAVHAAAGALIEAAIKLAAADGVTFPNATGADATTCAEMWSAMAGEESLKAMATPAASYEFQLTYNELCPNKTWAQAERHLRNVRACGVQAAAHWVGAITAGPAVKPAAAAQSMIQLVMSLFASGQCGC